MPWFPRLSKPERKPDPLHCQLRGHRRVDWPRCQAQNLVDRFFNRLKPFQRLTTRHDKLVCRVDTFLSLVCA